MPYEVVPLVASIFLGVYHVVVVEASRASKAIVAVVVTALAYVWLRAPGWLVPATILQAGVSIYVLIHARLSGRPV